jgi:CobQ-like glutamine amidotransferase family enzyme
MTDLLIAHLYPDLLRTYGDRDNVVALCRRAEWRGFSVRVEEVGLGGSIPAGANIVVLGGGTDRVQEVVGRDLVLRAAQLHEAIDFGAVVLGVCGGFQLLGSRYVLPNGREIPGAGVLDVETHAGPGRIVGRVRGTGRLWGQTFDLVGFENHSGRTRLGSRAAPLATASRGHGNNGRDHGEGACEGTVVGTYLHGPVLAINPGLADALLTRALAPRTGGEPLAPLDDVLERRAHDQFARRVRDEGRSARRVKVLAAGAAAILAFSAINISEASEHQEGRDDFGWIGGRVVTAIGEAGWIDGSERFP